MFGRSEVWVLILLNLIAGAVGADNRALFVVCGVNVGIGLWGLLCWIERDCVEVRNVG